MSGDQSPKKLLQKCIDDALDIALRLTLEKDQEPTFRNILHVIATCGHEWFLSLTTTGNFVQLSAGWMFVRQTNTVITDNTTMDEAVLHTLRNLSSFGKGVNLTDLCSYVSAAFRFPAVLSANEISEKVRCSAESMKVWGRISVDNGHYKLPDLEGTSKPMVVNCCIPKSKVEAPLLPLMECGLPSPVLDDPKDDRDKGANTTSPLECTKQTVTNKQETTDNVPNSSEYSTDSSDSVSDSDQDSITSSTSSRKSKATLSKLPRLPSETRRTNQLSCLGNRRKNENDKPFLYPNKCYKLFIAYHQRLRRSVDLETGDRVRDLFDQKRLLYHRIYVSTYKSHVAFAEVENIEDGNEAIETLNESLQERGAFKLIVQWATPTEWDIEAVREVKVRASRSPQPSSPSRRRRSRTRSLRRRSRSRSRSAMRRPLACQRANRSRSRSRSSRTRHYRHSNSPLVSPRGPASPPAKR